MSNFIIENIDELHQIINDSEVCYVGMTDGQTPYVLPFNFALHNNTIYLHSGPGGKKMDILNKNNLVCITFSTAHKMYHQHKDVACSWVMLFKSVIVWGKVSFIDEDVEKIEILNMIMKKYSGRDDFKYSTPAVRNVVVFKIPIDKITGKKKGY